jgi:hypothetical protein
VFYNQKIYMGLVSDTLDIWPTSGTGYDLTGMTQVWAGDTSWEGMGWHNIELDTPFSYDGTSNLVIMWETANNPQGTYPYPYWARAYVSGQYRTIYHYSSTHNPWDCTSRYRTYYVPICRLFYEFNDDVGPIAVDPEGLKLIPTDPSPVTIDVEVENFGKNYQSAGIPVTAEVWEKNVIYSSDFETDNGGWVPTASWDPVGDWEWTNTYDVSNYVGSYTPPDMAASGTGLWGTVIYDDYTNSGGESYLSQTFDFTTVSGAEISFSSWEEINGYFDYGRLLVNGVEEGRWDSTAGTSWKTHTIDLSAYSGMNP